MLFKSENLKAELASAPKRLQEIANYFDNLSLELCGRQAMVTRVLERIAGSSGVHEAHRAVDFRAQYVNEHGDLDSWYTADQITRIVSQLNERFPRRDKKQTCIYHSFNNGPYHFHLQVEAHWG